MLEVYVLNLAMKLWLWVIASEGKWQLQWVSGDVDVKLMLLIDTIPQAVELGEGGVEFG
jgi:hypothetical protein